MSQLSERKFTWRDLKKIVNRMPENQLKKEAIIWTDDERAYVIESVEVLKEDYAYDGDEGCAPKSAMKEADPKDWKENRDEYYTIHTKGTRIINATT